MRWPMTDPAAGASQDPRHAWRALAGNAYMYDTMGAAQFALLTLFFGLREHHRLLEIGAGSLRAARWLIPYLDTEHYCGVEPDRAAVAAGMQHELGPEIASRRRPRFSHDETFDFASFGETFDYVLSYSLFTHLPPSQVQTVFDRVAAVTHADSIVLATATFCDGEDERIVDHERWTILPVNLYSERRFVSAAACAGFHLLRLGHVFQDWFVAFRYGNQIAARGAAAMGSVAWDTVTPPWQDPGWPAARS